MYGTGPTALTLLLLWVQTLHSKMSLQLIVYFRNKSDCIRSIKFSKRKEQNRFIGVSVNHCKPVKLFCNAYLSLKFGMKLISWSKRHHTWEWKMDLQC